MPRGSSFSSVLTFFREGNEDEVRAILPLVIEAAGARHITIHAGASPRPARPTQVKRRKSFDRGAAARKAWATRRLNAANAQTSAAAA
jgi:hypothetical protein